MDLVEKNDSINKGKSLLRGNIFPNEIIENIREKRLQKEISNAIFYPKDLKPFTELNAAEKIIRNRELKIQLEFISYLHALNRAKILGNIYILFGIILLIFAVTDSHKNIPVSAIMLIEGSAMLLLFYKVSNVIKYIQITLIVLAASLIFELILFKIPDPFLVTLKIEHFRGKLGVILLILNQSAPIIYITVKLSVIILIVVDWLTIKKFKTAKANFESLKN